MGSTDTGSKQDVSGRGYIKAHSTENTHLERNTQTGNMRLLGEIPSVQDAIRHFKDMALGKLPKRQTGRGTKKLFGSWYESAPSVMKKQPTTTLVTPIAMDVEQAKSKLRRSGEINGKRWKRQPKRQGSKTPKKPTKGKKKQNGKKSKKPTPQKGRGKKRGKTPTLKKRQDNFR